MTELANECTQEGKSGRRGWGLENTPISLPFSTRKLMLPGTGLRTLDEGLGEDG